MGVVVFHTVIEDDMKIAFRARKPFSPLYESLQTLLHSI